jgi:hypothetical protein
VSFEVVDPLFFCNVVDFDLAIAVSECDLVLVAEGNGADVVVDLAGLVYAADVSGAAGPDVKGGIESDCDLVVVGPVQKVEVEIVLEVRGLQNFIGLLAYFTGFLLGGPLAFLEGFAEIGLV